MTKREIANAPLRTGARAGLGAPQFPARGRTPGGRLTGAKPSLDDFRGEAKPGEPLRDMRLRLAGDFVERAVEAATDAGPCALRPEMIPSFRKLEGIGPRGARDAGRRARGRSGLRRRRRNRERVNGTGQFFAENVVNHALTVDARPAPERLGRDFDAEMSLPLGTRARMSGMHVRFVDDFEPGRREGRRQFFPYGFGYRHARPAAKIR